MEVFGPFPQGGKRGWCLGKAVQRLTKAKEEEHAGWLDSGQDLPRHQKDERKAFIIQK